jgi:alpha-beta hydrolase superfamily lysophospholipase
MEQEVKFTSGGLQLSGTLRLPNSDGPLAVVLLVAGSGPLDRNENYKKLHINALREIAEFLAMHQVATFRYDKRGVGESEGGYWNTGFFDNVSDASSALTYLKSHPQVGAKPIFILGHSEGALICTRLATERSDVAGAILLAGAAQTGEKLLRWQAGEVAKTLRGFNRLIIRLLRIDVAKAQDKVLKKIKLSSKDWFRQGQITKINAKWFREFMAYDPAEDLPKIHAPVLALTGSKDIQVDPKDLIRMSEIVNADFEYHEIAGISHMLREAEGEPSVADYKRQLKQPVDSRLMQLIGEWLGKQIIHVGLAAMPKSSAG